MNGHVLKPKIPIIVIKVLLDTHPFLLEVINVNNFGIFPF